MASQFRSLFGPSLPQDLTVYQPDFLTQVFNLATMDPLQLKAGQRVVAATLAMKAIRADLKFLARMLGLFLQQYGKTFFGVRTLI